MAINARYVHTNLVARDWKKLAQFYETVLDCAPAEWNALRRGDVAAFNRFLVDRNIAGVIAAPAGTS